MRQVEMHVDGACSGNGTEEAIGGAGIVWKDGNVIITHTACHKTIAKLCGKYNAKVTNQTAELCAAGIGMALLKDQGLRIDLLLFTDSKYAAGLLAGGHRASTNVNLVVAVKNQMQHFNTVVIQYVAGHDGNHLNEIADGLAKRGKFADADTTCTINDEL